LKAIEVAVGRFGNVADKLIQANKEINRLSQTCEDECKTINLLNTTLSQHTKLGSNLANIIDFHLLFEFTLIIKVS